MALHAVTMHSKAQIVCIPNTISIESVDDELPGGTVQKNESANELILHVPLKLLCHLIA